MTKTQQPAAPPPRARTWRRLPRAGAFGVVLAALLTLNTAAAAPSPLYVVFQHRFGFSATTLTLVFGVYAVALLGALLTVGGLSAHLGRRPVLAAALALDAVAMLVFLTADGVPGLLLARIVQGLATGSALGVVSAYLVDLQPPHRPTLGSLLNSVGATVGLAVGALGSGLVIQAMAAPSGPVFATLAALLAALAGTVLVLPETVGRRPGALRSLRPRVGVPAHARPHFLAAAPAIVAGWAIGGLYLSLGPSLALGVLHAHSRLTGGLVITTLMATASLAGALVRDVPPRRVMTGGALLLAVGTALTLAALALGSLPGFFAGTAVAGAGFGPAFLGAFRSLAALAAPHERAELFAAIFVAGYLSFSVPAVVAGAVTPGLGLRTTATGYGVVVVLLALVTGLRPARSQG
ncbi:MAG: MFS transporter, partial [Motilibacteraceae bacterium]